MVQSEGYQHALHDPSLPVKARHFLAYACLLERLREFGDAGWSALHAAWVCDDANHTDGACRCREQAMEYWKRGKHAVRRLTMTLRSSTLLSRTCTAVWLDSNSHLSRVPRRSTWRSTSGY